MAVTSAFRTLPLDERRKQYDLVMESHPEKVPVILERAPSATIPTVDRSKYLLPRDFTVGAFLDILRRRTSVGEGEALFVYVRGTVPAGNVPFGALYEQHRDLDDGFLYVTYTGESSFGAR
jgi:GABA(A) receptor-associated protein